MRLPLNINKEFSMSVPDRHQNRQHRHGIGCGHIAVEHVIEVTGTNPDRCTHGAKGHEPEHVHGPDCGHPAVPHGDHLDYLVDGRLHHVHGDHCDDHGALKTSTP